LTLHQPLSVEATLTTSARVVEVLDKGKGASIAIEAVSVNEDGEKVCTNRFTVFIRGLGGFGGERGGKSTENLTPPKNKKPDAVQMDKTMDNLALYYRLSSLDMNPLHADPNMAAMGNFPKPILHGLCTFGHAGRAVLKHFCNNDTKRFKEIKVRFSKHVFPGETIVTEMFKVSATRVLVQCRVKERDGLVISQAYCEVEDMNTLGKNAAASDGGGSGGDGAFAECEALFEKIGAGIAAQGTAAVKAINGIFRLDLSSDNGNRTWTIDLKNGSGGVKTSDHPKADVTISMAASDFVALSKGKLNPQQAFMQGKMKMKGNMGMAMKLGKVLKPGAAL